MMDENQFSEQEAQAMLQVLAVQLRAHPAVHWPGLGDLARVERHHPDGPGHFFILTLRPGPFWVQALRLRIMTQPPGDAGWLVQLSRHLLVTEADLEARLERWGRALVGLILAQGGAATPMGNFALVHGERTLPNGRKQRLSFVDYWPAPALLEAVQPDGHAVQSALRYYQHKARQAHLAAVDNEDMN